MMNKVRKIDIAIVILCMVMVVILGACAPAGIPAGDFCDVYSQPVIFTSSEGVSAAIDGESDLLDRAAITQILAANEYHSRHCGG